jgi:hypothetical protein
MIRSVRWAFGRRTEYMSFPEKVNEGLISTMSVGREALGKAGAGGDGWLSTEIAEVDDVPETACKVLASRAVFRVVAPPPVMVPW